MPSERDSRGAKSPDDLRQYQDLVETSQDLIWQSDAHGRYTYLNPVWEATFGYKIEEMLGKRLSDFQSPDTAEHDTRELPRLIQAGAVKGYETVCIGKAGKPIHLALYARQVCDEHGQVTGARGTAHDITERRQATEALARSAHEWQETFDATLDAIWVLDKDHRIVRSNRMAQQMFDRPSSAMIGQHCWEIVHGTAGPIPECPALRARNSLRRESMQLQLGRRWLAVYVDPILDGNGNYSGSVHIVSDITERKQGEQALRESEERFRKIVERAPIAMAIVSLDGVIELINQKAVEVFGYLPEDIPNMERWWVQAYPDQEYRKEVVALWTALVQKAVREDQEIPSSEYQVTCKDGTIKTILISGVPISDRIFVLFDDISERKRAEVRLQKTLERLDLATRAARLSPPACRGTFFAGITGYQGTSFLVHSSGRSPTACAFRRLLPGL